MLSSSTPPKPTPTPTPDGGAKPIDLSRLRLSVPAEIFQLPLCRSFAKAVFLILLLGGILAWGTGSEGLVLRLILGITAGPLVFTLASLGHEAGHRTASRSRFLNDLTGVLTMSLLGMPTRGWQVKHDLHHRFGGVPGRDTDGERLLGSYLSRGAFMRGLVRTWCRHEYLFWWATPVSLWITTWTYAVRNLLQRADRYKRLRRWTLVDMGVSTAFFVAVGLYTWTFGWLNLLLMVALPFAVCGLVAAVCFIPNHRGMPPLTARQARRAARYAHVNSRTIVYPSCIPANYFMNHVPWQIEHHVFPTVAGFRLRALSFHLREFARQEGIGLTYASVFAVMPSLLRRRWLWGGKDGELCTFGEAEAILRRQRSPAES